MGWMNWSESERLGNLVRSLNVANGVAIYPDSSQRRDRLLRTC